MSDTEEPEVKKRKTTEEEEEKEKDKKPKDAKDESGESDDDDGWVGPLPSEAAPTKKVRVLKHEKLYLSHLPSAEGYERSYMHR